MHQNSFVTLLNMFENLKSLVFDGLVSHVVHFSVDVVNAEVHGLDLEGAEQRPGVEPALVLVAVRPQGDTVGVEPRKLVLQALGRQQLYLGTAFPEYESSIQTS